MSSLTLLLSFSFFLLSFASSSPFNTTHKCSPKETLALLLFKENLSSINYVFGDPPYHSPCQDWLGSDYHPIMMNWNMSTDCCDWDGISCDHFTSNVIGIDLSCGMLRGIIHPNTTLFHLPHLQRLNLAYNDLYHSQLLREIGRFSNSLSHLNISRCGFTGEISSEILFLSELVSLDLSQNYLRIQPYVLNTLLKNSTHLRELLIANVHVDWVLPTYLNISSSLKSLVLSDTGLKRKLPENIFNLQYLEKLLLSNNDITGQLPEANKNINIPLKWLGLSSTNLSGEIPNSIGHLQSLSYLSLSSCGLVGSLPKSLVNLRHLTTLDLSYNKLNGTLPSFLFTLPLIENILLDGNMLTGGLPSKLFKCRSLKKLSLGSNQFDGESNHGSTSSFMQLINLTYLDLSSNKVIGLGELDTLLSSLPNLKELYLSSSGLSLVTNNSSSHVNPNFRYLGVASCKLTVFPKFLRDMKNLVSLDLSDNDIHGHIPDWAGEIGGNELLYLNLSHNSIASLPRFQWDTLNFLYLQSNQIQGPFPASICSMRNLRYLDMSNNRFDEVIPRCFANIISSSMMINMGNNRFHGSIPNVNGDCGHLNGIILKNNQLEGEVPISLSKCQGLKLLDLGYNRLNGTFPGNPELCGLPLPKKCEQSQEPHREVDEDNDSGFTWRVVMLGYGSSDR
ncbi:hypothetical protein L2E82_31645 [Cichorium intybus]|uniref:Uncharacterized protein n=1 Tax=Cichorium intybus TaxID=13427 RepID=A0ACB9BFE9_CICIN|nr:hypothetical protein L2E82_31645 [Cichorium intybus]